MKSENKTESEPDDITKLIEQTSLILKSKNGKISGIYKIINLTNSKYYVGSSKNILKRWLKHKFELRKGIHKNQHLQLAWNKQNGEQFEFVIIKIVSDDKLLKIEQTYLNICKSNLNQTYNKKFDASGGKSPGENIWTPEKRKQHGELSKQYWTPERIKERSDKMKGKLVGYSFASNPKLHKKWSTQAARKRWSTITADQREIHRENCRKAGRLSWIRRRELQSVSKSAPHISASS